jgi:hypothetical protein
MREITEEEKEEICDWYYCNVNDNVWTFLNELTRRGFKIVKEENPK